MGKHRSGHSYQEFPILNVARRCGLVLNDRTLEWEEVEASCPFCGDHGPGKHHLFLNTTRNIFRCVLCGEKGNSVSLYAKMEGVSNRQAFRALSEDSVLYRFPQQPLSQKPAEREPSSLAVRHNVYYDTLPFPLVYLYGSAGIDGFICAVFFLVAANRVNKHGLLFAWAGIYGLIQGVMGYMFLFPYFLAVGLIAELSMLGKDTYRNPLRTRIGWTINCVGNFVGCAVPLWWAWDSYTAMALESGFTSETLEMQMAMVTSPALMLLGAAITAVLTFLGTLFGQRLLRKHFQKAGIVG